MNYPSLISFVINSLNSKSFIIPFSSKSPAAVITGNVNTALVLSWLNQDIKNFCNLFTDSHFGFVKFGNTVFEKSDSK